MGRIVIANRGRCSREAVELIGLSTKRDDVSQVGQFGSGVAFAVSLALRENLFVRISSEDGDGAYVMEPWSDSKDRIHWRFRSGSPLIKRWWHNVSKAVGRAKSVPTSFTKGFGELDWSGVFPVLREFITNARDADPSGYRVWRDLETNVVLHEFLEMAEMSGANGVTLIEIDGNTDSVIESWDNYFRFECGLVDHVPSVIDVFRVSPLVALMKPKIDDDLLLFVKGVRIPHGFKKKARYSYSLDIGLTEARTLKSEFDFTWEATHLLSRAADKLGPEWIAGLLKWINLHPDSFEASTASEFITIQEGKWREGFRHAFNDAPVASPVDNKTTNSVVMPHAWATLLKKDGVRTTVKPLASKNSSSIGWIKPGERGEDDTSTMALEVIEHYERCLSDDWSYDDGLKLTQEDINRLRNELELE